MDSKNELLLAHLKEQFPESSRRTFEGWVKAGRVYIEERKARHLNEKVAPGESISLGRKPNKKLEKLGVLFQDRDLIVINKPAGLLSVRSDGGGDWTAHDMIKRAVTTKVFVIHRLDKETSGVMLFAFTEKAYKLLKSQFAAKTAGRTYAAIVEGTELPDQGRWENYLADSELIVKTTPSKAGRLAIANYEVVAKNRELSFIKVKLETGRKNQIRVQAAEIGAPVVGDKKYGSKINPIRRLGLHAAKLCFTHPATENEMIFEAPIPPSFLAPFRRDARSIEETFKNAE